MSSVASSVASSVTSSVAANPTNGACGATSFNKLPTDDAACAVANNVGLPSNISDVLSKCCKDAPVEKTDNDCASYCLSVGQSNGDLISCLQGNGVNGGQIFCNKNMTASATGKPSDSKKTGTASGTAAGATNSEGAAPAVMAPQNVSKAGLGMLAMLFVSAAAGALM